MQPSKPCDPNCADKDKGAKKAAAAAEKSSVKPKSAQMTQRPREEIEPSTWETLCEAIEKGFDPDRPQHFIQHKLVPMAGGVFTMGTDTPLIAGDGESPARQYKLTPFAIDAYEVTETHSSL